ncbi:MAG: chemotaxis protein CheW [bacterium]|nr:chemotaxis protein CheW [bacterium]
MAKYKKDLSEKEINNILSKRAEELAKEIKMEIQTGREILSFRLGREWYGLDLDKYNAIVREFEIISLPYALECSKGIINLKGNIIPVLDLKRLLELNQEEEEGKEEYICIIFFSDIRIGFLIDEIGEIISVSKEKITPPLSTIDRLKIEYIEGEFKYDNQIITLLEIDNVLSSEIKTFHKPEE